MIDDEITQEESTMTPEVTEDAGGMASTGNPRPLRSYTDCRSLALRSCLDVVVFEAKKGPTGPLRRVFGHLD